MPEANELRSEDRLDPSLGGAPQRGGAGPIPSPAEAAAIINAPADEPPTEEDIKAVRDEGTVLEAASEETLAASAAEAVVLKDATDDEIRALADETVDRTANGQPKVDALNERLEAAGFNGINGAKRDELFPVQTA